MTEYFSHDYDSREDEKIQELIYKLGMEGYGIYWSVVEMLYKNDGYMQTHYERIAHALHVDSKQVKSVVTEFGLFDINETTFHSESVLRRLELRKDKSVSAKKAADARWGKNRDVDADALQTQCDSNAIKERKEIKEKKKKSVFSPPTLEEFKDYFKQNGYSISVAQKAWAGYDVTDWHDSQGNKIKSWKQKCQHVWFRDEHKDGEKVVAPANPQTYG